MHINKVPAWWKDKGERGHEGHVMPRHGRCLPFHIRTIEGSRTVDWLRSGLGILVIYYYVLRATPPPTAACFLSSGDGVGAALGACLVVVHCCTEGFSMLESSVAWRKIGAARQKVVGVGCLCSVKTLKPRRRRNEVLYVMVPIGHGAWHWGSWSYDLQ
jgi:hypothetical protein